MRIVHLYHNFAPQRGGIEDYLAAITQHQAQQPGLEPIVLTANTKPFTAVETYQGVRVIRAATWGRYFTPLCPSWGAWLQRLKPDWLHLHLPCPLGEWVLALTPLRTRLIVSLHNDYVRPAWALRWHYPFHHASLQRAHHIATSSPDYAASSAALADFQNKVVIVPYGVDLERYCPSPAPPQRLVLTAGRLCYYKGLEVLLAAAPSIHAPIQILGDGPYRQRLQRQAQRAAQVAFCGAVAETALIQALQRSAVFAFPSTERAEAFGLAQLKAMACGTPVISTNLPGVRWLNQHGQSGWVVPVRDATALATALNQVLLDASLRAHLSLGARARATEFPLTRMLQATDALYV